MVTGHRLTYNTQEAKMKQLNLYEENDFSEKAFKKTSGARLALF